MQSPTLKNKKIVIAGGTGFIGQALAGYFGKDNQITILSRHAVHAHNNAYHKKLLEPAEGYRITYWRWDGLRVEKHWADAISGADIVINLAGRSVNCRYTQKNKQEILESRRDATRAIGLAIREAAVPPKVWINAASATIYRHAEDHPQDEYAEAGAPSHFSGEFNNGFSVQVCKAWEKAFEEERTPFTRKIALRTAITLGEGGAIVPYLKLLKFGLGGHQGNGRQMFSWVHVEDVCRAIEWIYDHDELEGIFNISSPCPVTNREFMATLRKVTGHRIGLPAPAWLLKAGAAVIGTETELVLKSRWVLPTRLSGTGFTFKYAEPLHALKDIVERLPHSGYRLF